MADMDLEVELIYKGEANAALYVLRAFSLPIPGMAILNSILLIISHARQNRHAALRVYTVRILFMVVLNSLGAVFALWGTAWMPSAGKTVNDVVYFVEEFYQSVVIFSFSQFILASGAGSERLASQFQSRTIARKVPPQAVPDILDAMAATSVDTPERVLEQRRHVPEESLESGSGTAAARVVGRLNGEFGPS